MTYFSRNSCLYCTQSGGVDFLLVLFLAVSSHSKSFLTKSLHKCWEGTKTTIDWDCGSQCLRGGAGLHCKPYFSMTLSTGWKKKSLNKFCGKEASVLLYMYVKYRIFTQNIYKIFANFLRGILAFQKNDKSFARDLYQSNLSDKTRKTYNQINIILTHCQVNKIKIKMWLSVTLFYC